MARRELLVRATPSSHGCVYLHGQAQCHAHAHTHAHTQSHTHTHTQDTHTQSHTHTYTHTCHTHSHTHAHTQDTLDSQQMGALKASLRMSRGFVTDSMDDCSSSEDDSSCPGRTSSQSDPEQHYQYDNGRREPRSHHRDVGAVTHQQRAHGAAQRASRMAARCEDKCFSFPFFHFFPFFTFFTESQPDGRKVRNQFFLFTFSFPSFFGWPQGEKTLFSFPFSPFFREKTMG